MAKVKLLVPMASVEALTVGHIHECDDAEAKRLIEAGYAVPHGEEKPIERAVKPRAPERRKK